MALKPKLNDLVIVDWLDATHASGWQSKQDVNVSIEETLSPCRTVGWIIGLTDKFIVLAQSKAPYEDGGIWAIPFGMIQTILKLKEMK